jgi:biopolymer transport protein ExbB
MNFSFLLQATPEASAPAKTTTYQSVWDIISKSNEGLGLFINLILLAMAAWTIFVFIERYLATRNALLKSELLDNVIADIKNENIKSAITRCKNSKLPESRMLEKGLQKIGRPGGDNSVSIAMENGGKFEILTLEKRLNSLATMAGAAPMVGFLGTVIGMVSVFYELSESQSLEIKTIAPGIMTAMITTVGGLIVGIIAFMGYNFLVGQIGKVIYRMEDAAQKILETINEKQDQKKITQVESTQNNNNNNRENSNNHSNNDTNQQSNSKS